MRIAMLILTLTAGLVCTATAAPPQLKSGLWRITVQSANSRRPPRTSRLCVDDKTLSLLAGAGDTSQSQSCSRNDKHFDGARMIVDSVCRFGRSVATSHVVVTYNGEQAYRVESHSHYAPPFFGRTDTASQQSGTWAGQCPAGMKPGDMVTSEGMRINVLQAASIRH